ncbi:WRKY family transcription factor [Actinidia rufa]|uniref:WRKY family transcription factor n=1 Tax=Actinidia rufa TaxID=165716 RepID=A0A7J0FXD4_9ERIC|nr:WRKY family transcription factor [Actinidia rufa]
MDRGWGLTLESDPIGLFENKPRLNRNLFLGMEFPVNLNRRGEQGNSQPLVCTFLQLTPEAISPWWTMGSHRLQKINELRMSWQYCKFELERMNAENQRLRGMLSQVSNNYSTLQLHLMTIMQQQQQQQQQQSLRAESTHQHQIAEGRSEDKKQESVLPRLPRQFMELGPIAAMETDDPPSQSSSEERTHSGSIHNNKNDVVPFDQEKGNYRDGKVIGREESPESDGWVPNKVPKLNASKSGVDQAAEATMRKARVSVRARSEAPMMDVNGGSMDRRWRKAIPVLELIIGAPWQLVVQCANK